MGRFALETAGAKIPPIYFFPVYIRQTGTNDRRMTFSTCFLSLLYNSPSDRSYT